MAMKALRIRMTGRQDKNEDDYYFTTTNVPVAVDLSNAVIHFYPDEGENGEFGGELVIRHYDPKKKDKPLRRRRRKSKPEDGAAATSEPDDMVVEDDEDVEGDD